MKTLADTTSTPIVARPSLENSIWYGSALFSFLAAAEMSEGRYALLRWRMQKGFTPPAPHRHGPEDFYIIRGRLHCWVADKGVVATDGDYIRTPPRRLAHLPGGVGREGFCGVPPALLTRWYGPRAGPAEAMELPAGRPDPPDPARLRALAPKYGAEFAPPGTRPEDMRTWP